MLRAFGLTACTVALMARCAEAVWDHDLGLAGWLGLAIFAICAFASPDQSSPPAPPQTEESPK